MAFLRRLSSVFRQASRFELPNETNTYLLQRQGHEHSFLTRFVPLLGARFMCSVPSTKLFVGGLVWGMDENGLRDAFLEFGEVVEAKVVLDRDSGRSKGFGFVSFTCTDHAEAAKNAMDGKVFNGRTLRVNFAIEKQRAFGGFGGYGGGGFGGGGDNSSSYGNSSFNNGSSFSSGNTADDKDGFFSNNTASLEGPFHQQKAGDSFAKENPGIGDDFFGDDVFDYEKNDSDKNDSFMQGYK
ncbi:hypothetical protein KP509_32G026600 [Ceratopteris richardii]|uniref:RRM domain-containing protein n=1 Tax=Ceratopteris richardii TaxID=49495 RepID=A0A8T2QTU1_CERRI|nr:hypothetical protein KP509_32G026600 [Ceratopteris richardii]